MARGPRRRLATGIFQDNTGIAGVVKVRIADTPKQFERHFSAATPIAAIQAWRSSMKRQYARAPADDGTGVEAPTEPPRRRLYIDLRVWRGDPLLQELDFIERALLLELHGLAGERGEWPFIPSEPTRLAAQLPHLHINVTTVARSLKACRALDPPLVMATQQAGKLELRSLDAISFKP